MSSMDIIKKEGYLEELRVCRYPRVKNWSTIDFLIFVKGWVLLDSHYDKFLFPFYNKTVGCTVEQRIFLLKYYEKMKEGVFHKQ